MRLIASIVVLAACAREPTVDELPEQAAPAPKPAGDTPAVQGGYLGVLNARGVHDVVAPFTSTLTELKVRVGDEVKANQVIARFDKSVLEQDLAGAKATLAQRGSMVGASKVALDSAKKELASEQQAFADKIVPKLNVDRAESKVHAAEQAVVGASADYEAQRQAVDKLEKQLKKATVLAPADGRASLPRRHEGERVDEGQVILQIISGDDLFIRFAIPGDKAGTIIAGDQVDAIFDKGIRIKVKVRSVDASLDSVAQMIIAEADLVGPADKLQAGQRCHIVPPKPASR